MLKRLQNKHALRKKKNEAKIKKKLHRFCQLKKEEAKEKEKAKEKKAERKEKKRKEKKAKNALQLVVDDVDVVKICKIFNLGSK